MAVSLFKLVVSASTSTTTDTVPDVSRYFYKMSAAHRSATTTIPYGQFYDDAGNSMTTNLTTATADDGYYLLFINGVLQETGIYTVGSNGSQIAITNASTAPLSAPVTFVVNNFAPVSTSTTTITT